MENTSGFYKLDGSLLYAPHDVLGPDYELLSQYHNTYTYPVDGWYWFDSEEEAKAFFEVQDDQTQ